MNTSIQLYNSTPITMPNALPTVPAFDSELLSNSASKIQVDIFDALHVGRFLGAFPWTATTNNCLTYAGLGTIITLLDTAAARPKISNTEKIKLIGAQLYADAVNIYDVQTLGACLSFNIPTCAAMIAGRVAHDFIKDRTTIEFDENHFKIEI